MMGARTRGAATHAVALAGTLLLGGAMMLDAASAHAGATRVPAFKNGTGWNCDGVPPAGSTPPAGAAVIGLAGSAQNPVVHGTAQMRGLLPNTTYTLRLYKSTGTLCSSISATDVTTNAQGNATATLSAPRQLPYYAYAFFVAFNNPSGTGWLSRLAPTPLP